MKKLFVTPSTPAMQVWADRLGLCLSFACLIHCLATPILMIALPSLSIFVADHGHDHGNGHEIFHEVLLGILPLIAVLAFIPGYRLHRNLKIFYWAGPGILALAVGVIFSHDAPLAATGITILGSLLLVRAHFLNRKECACCRAGHGHNSNARLAVNKAKAQPISLSSRITEIKTPLASTERL